ncbi:D-glycero-alpha-D-manno-heptose-1,7-bisphosphate 7-phosphatase [Azospira restricta]|uniref:D,D-heptose 1,7-bisphosphate phosphatase n=1 Tax=Azospira restricta TaxID=404405 RepID=A0A974Y3T4_9RHOO|nr:D-glycero-beta-D-manno-heptose 1,7-bisphosphate 7-phosphatase [Azospira restricta]QRJ64069.1 D-glycero-beta-D-manno-heptose 1,7-bisphosphate 7-phosphatase [Azospira restricta]
MNISESRHDRALLLDRDGVINVNHGYVHSKDNFDFIEGIFDLVRTARALGYRVVVVTNQAGIGRGYYSEAQFHELTAWMCEQFERQGAPIDKVYFSPYHPTAGIGEYRQDEDTRKPGPGMILRAHRELGVSLEKSILIGDKPSDIQAGVAAGVGLNILFSNESPAALEGLRYVPVRTLKDAISCLEGAGTALALR